MDQPSPTAAPLTADEFSAAISAVTSAFGDRTRREIYLWIREHHEGVTVAEIAERFELHPNVARHHLEKLASGGYLSVGTSDSPAAAVPAAGTGSGAVPVALIPRRSAGRPSKRYHALPIDATLTFPPRRDDLMATLLARALTLLPPDEAAVMAEDVGYEYGRQLAARMAPTDSTRSVRAAMATVADALTAHGFAAHAEARGRGYVIVEEHCPFGEAAQRFPHVVCSVDRGMIRGMLAGLYGETQPHFEASRPGGDGHCVACIER